MHAIRDIIERKILKGIKYSLLRTLIKIFDILRTIYKFIKKSVKYINLFKKCKIVGGFFNFPKFEVAVFVLVFNKIIFEIINFVK